MHIAACNVNTYTYEPVSYYYGDGLELLLL